MKIRTIFVLSGMALLWGCEGNPEEVRTLQWKQEIRETELAFSDLSEREGIAKAFLTYAAEEAVLMRNNQLIRGREAIRNRFEEISMDPEAITLTWEPEFVEVSASGDLGYTYGFYTLTTTDSLDNKSTSTGVFHTVWKRQEDGTWRFVWD